MGCDEAFVEYASCVLMVMSALVQITILDGEATLIGSCGS